MANARGNEAVLLGRRQVNFGTPEAAADGAFMELPFYSYSVTPSGELASDDANYGDSMPGEAVAGLRNLAGSMAVPLGMASIGWHLSQLLGLPTTSGTGPYSHVFVAARQQALVLATHGISHAGIDQHFVQDSLALTGLEIQAQKNGQRQRVSLNLVGREEVPAGATLDATPVGYAADPVPVGFQGALAIDGAASGAITQAQLGLNSGREVDQETLNGLATAAGIDPGFWDLSGSLTARFRDRALYDLADAGTPLRLTLSWQIDAGNSLEIDVPSARLERTGHPVEGRDLISASFNWRSNRPATGAELITFTLVNGVAGYANPS